MSTKDIDPLLVRFLNAQTTEEEERTLAEFFRTHSDIPQAWQPYRQLFISFNSNIYNPKTASQPAAHVSSPYAKNKSHLAMPLSRIRPMVIWASCIAASIVVALGIIFSHDKPSQQIAQTSIQQSMPQSSGTTPALTHKKPPTTITATSYSPPKPTRKHTQTPQTTITNTLEHDAGNAPQESITAPQDNTLPTETQTIVTPSQHQQATTQNATPNTIAVAHPSNSASITDHHANNETTTHDTPSATKLPLTEADLARLHRQSVENGLATIKYYLEIEKHELAAASSNKQF